jgi:hypothetical protein
VYATAQVHDVDGRDYIYDGKSPVGVDAGFEVAPGEPCDVEVANAHAWGSWSLVFTDDKVAATSLYIAKEPRDKGITFSFEFILKNSSRNQVKNGAVAIYCLMQREESAQRTVLMTFFCGRR